MRVHGDKKIVRRTGIDRLNAYQDAREFLEQDFCYLCGYCGKDGKVMHQKFQIDHFVPKSIFPEGEKKYGNLVLACAKCNLGKANKWPTGDPHIPNDGEVGFVDPASEEFDENVERNQDGFVIGITPVGKDMCRMLNLDVRRSDIYWKISRLRSIQRKLDVIDDKGELKEQEKDFYIKLTKLLNSYIDEAFEKGE